MAVKDIAARQQYVFEWYRRWVTDPYLQVIMNDPTTNYSVTVPIWLRSHVGIAIARKGKELADDAKWAKIQAEMSFVGVLMYNGLGQRAAWLAIRNDKDPKKSMVHRYQKLGADYSMTPHPDIDTLIFATVKDANTPQEKVTTMSGVEITRLVYRTVGML